MDRKRQLALVFATIGIALGAGHLVQSGQGRAEVAATPATTNVNFVSAGPAAPVGPAPEAAVPAVVVADLNPPEVETPPVADAGVATPAPEADAPALVVADLSPPEVETPPVADALAAPTPLRPASTLGVPALLNDLVLPTPPQSTTPAASVSGAASDAVAPASSSPEVPAPTLIQATPAATDTAEVACAITMKVAAAPQAMIGVSIVAPCAPDARVVIEHEGLAITGQTDTAGSLFLSLPALAVDASVMAYVADADPVSESLRIPALATLRRFGVQWQDKDTFQVHAFEGGADYGDAGHLSAAAPHTPTTGAAPTGGYMTLLGDPTVALPMLAEVYTFPSGGIANAEVLIEAAVTEATCGRTVAGETIITLAGEAHLAELTLAMPDCDGVGDILVLKNLVPDLTIAAAN